MESRARLFGHPIHQMLVVFPLGLLGASVVFDLIALLTDSASLVPVAFWLIAAGLVGVAVAAPFGLVDWLAIPAGTRAARIGAMHGLGNVVVGLLFAGSWLLRWMNEQAITPLALTLSLLGVALSGLTAWLGGELVSRLGVGVSEGAHLDAPSSLDRRPASDVAQPLRGGSR